MPSTHRLLLGLDRLHAEVHGHHDGPARRPRPRARPARAGVDPLEGRSCAPRSSCRARSGLASASLLFYVLYSPLRGPVRRPHAGVGLHVPRHARGRAVVDGLPRSSGATRASTCCSCSSGLQGIPDDVYEAARIDGASRWQTFRDITLPLLRPTLRAHDRALRHRLAARVRAVLHPHQGRPRQQHDDDRPAHLQRRLPGPEQPRHRRGALGHRPARAHRRSTSSSCARSAARTRAEHHDHAARPSRRPTSCASTASPTRRGRSTAARFVLGIPYWVFTTALAVIFLYPLVWTAVSSVQPRAGTSQTDGWGFGNYVALAELPGRHLGVPRQLARSSRC